jgi:protein-disulfide isomerase
MAKRLAGTPSFLIGDRLFVGRIPDAELEQLLGAAARR